ncbi:MAG TPA: SDR family NAD(P)-dependent oxidoreductase [Solirubrobacteraceae bacterium]|jgi:short-subunit dehydrogenase|nr:SDR family NAD(P)-dependent oxidoreductase [Solirubrobacteraceae bacterium]
MKNLQGRVALVTGASGGLGTHIARRLAREGMSVAVSGRREDALARVAAELNAQAAKSLAIPADLSDLTQVDPLVEGVEAALGPIDVLVNNAGVESIGAFTSYTREELTSTVDVNLTAPLLLTHRLTPGMLERGHGHVVFIASIAGKVGPAFNEPYAATKAGLVGLTQSLRAEYLRAPIGFSVVCPGFIAGDGMYARMVQEGHSSNRMMGETTTEKISDAVVQAIRKDRAEILESGAPIRLLLAIAQLAPGLVERMTSRFGVTELFHRVAVDRGRSA